MQNSYSHFIRLIFEKQNALKERIIIDSTRKVKTWIGRSSNTENM